MISPLTIFPYFPFLLLLPCFYCTVISGNTSSKIPEKRLKCEEEESVIITERIEDSAREFQRKLVVIDNNDEFIPSNLLNDVCKTWEEQEKKLRRRRTPLGIRKNVQNAVAEVLLAKMFEVNYNNWMMIRSFLSKHVKNASTIQNRNYEILKSLEGVLLKNELSGILLEHSKITEVIKSLGDKNKGRNLAKHIFVDTLYCYNHGGQNYSLNFEIVSPRPEKLVVAKTCGNVGYIQDGQYHFFDFEGMAFQNGSGVFNVQKNKCVKKNVLICPTTAIEPIGCSIYNTSGCKLNSLPLKSNIWRKLPVGYLVYGSIKKLYVSSKSGKTPNEIDINPYTLIHILPGQQDNITYGEQVFTGNGRQTQIEEV